MGRKIAKLASDSYRAVGRFLYEYRVPLFCVGAALLLPTHEVFAQAMPWDDTLTTIQEGITGTTAKTATTAAVAVTGIAAGFGNHGGIVQKGGQVALGGAIALKAVQIVNALF